MVYKLSREDRKWIYEQLDISLRATPKERLLYLESIQKLYLIAAKQRGGEINPSDLEAKIEKNLSLLGRKR